MGTTVAGLIMHGTKAMLFNIGDSRIYRWDGQLISQLSVDDARGVASGMTTSGITQALGARLPADIDYEPHARFITLEPSVDLLLCSDGLSDVVRPAELERILVQGRGVGPTCQLLVQQAIESGADDNISVILASFSANFLPPLGLRLTDTNKTPWLSSRWLDTGNVGSGSPHGEVADQLADQEAILPAMR